MGLGHMARGEHRTVSLVWKSESNGLKNWTNGQKLDIGQTTYVHVCPSVKYQEKEYVDARKGVIKHSP